MAEYVIECEEDGSIVFTHDFKLGERIVRCKECRNSRYDGTYCDHPMLDGGFDGDPCLDVHPDGFCAWGEVKDGL